MAICESCGMSGLVEVMDKTICKKCRRLETLERKIMCLELQFQELTRKVDRQDDQSVIRKESSAVQQAEEGKKMHTVSVRRSPTVEPEQPRKKRPFFKYVGGAPEEISKEDKVLVVGSSNVRNVGQNLAQQADKFVALCCPGGRIEDMKEMMEHAGEEAETCVFEVGTNNLFSDETADIVAKYQQLLEESKAKTKRVIVAGILPRKLSVRMEEKRKEVNRQLKKLCKAVSAEYLDVEFNYAKDGYLGKDGLHLNWRGAEKVARLIFDRVKCTCKCCLN